MKDHPCAKFSAVIISAILAIIPGLPGLALASPGASADHSGAFEPFHPVAPGSGMESNVVPLAEGTLSRYLQEYLHETSTQLTILESLTSGDVSNLRKVLPSYVNDLRPLTGSKTRDLVHRIFILGVKDGLEGGVGLLRALEEMQDKRVQAHADEIRQYANRMEALGKRINVVPQEEREVIVEGFTLPDLAKLKAQIRMLFEHDAAAALLRESELSNAGLTNDSDDTSVLIPNPWDPMALGIESEFVRVNRNGRPMDDIPGPSQQRQLLATMLGGNPDHDSMQTVTTPKHGIDFKGTSLDPKGDHNAHNVIVEISKFFMRPTIEYKRRFMQAGRTDAEWQGMIRDMTGALEYNTPPLDPGTPEWQRLKAGHSNEGRLRKLGFGRGIMTSTQFNFTIAHNVEDPERNIFRPQDSKYMKIKPKANVSQFVDNYIRWANLTKTIFLLFSPWRGGTLANMYAQPVAALFPEMLAAWAALPYEERTYERVSEIAWAYKTSALQSVGNEEQSAFKYSDLNFAQFFGLGKSEGKKKPILEIRLIDVAIGEPRIFDLVLKLRDAIFLREPSGQHETFNNPFADLGTAVRSLPKISRSILSLSDDEYNASLELLGLNPSDHPQLARLKPPFWDPKALGLDKLPSQNRAWAENYSEPEIWRLRIMERALAHAAPIVLEGFSMSNNDDPTDVILRLVENALFHRFDMIARQFGQVALIQQNDPSEPYKGLRERALRHSDSKTRSAAEVAMARVAPILQKPVHPKQVPQPDHSQQFLGFQIPVVQP